MAAVFRTHSAPRYSNDCLCAFSDVPNLKLDYRNQKKSTKKKTPRRLGAPDREGSLSKRYLTTREVEYGSINHSNPAPAHLLVIECVERISGWQHRRPEKNTPPTRASSRRGKRKEMREPDKEVTIYSSRCGIHAKVIPRNRSRRMCSGGWAAWEGWKKNPYRLGPVADRGKLHL